MCLFVVRLYGNGNKYKSKAGKNKGLNKADEQFQPVKRNSEEPRDKEGGNQQQDFTSSHISKKSECEADNANEFGKAFQKAGKDTYASGEHSQETFLKVAPEDFSYPSPELAEVEELAKVAGAEPLQSIEFNENKGNQRQRQRHIDIGICRPKQVCFALGGVSCYGTIAR